VERETTPSARNKDSIEQHVLHRSTEAQSRSTFVSESSSVCLCCNPRRQRLEPSLTLSSRLRLTPSILQDFRQELPRGVRYWVVQHLGGGTTLRNSAPAQQRNLIRDSMSETHLMCY
jgi:hypothetical protein